MPEVSTRKRQGRFIVPDEYMIPVGNAATQRLDRCAENWTDSEVELLRAELPTQYHAVPLDALRIRWCNLRKNGEFDKANGHGAAIRSRKKKPKPPAHYLDYITNDPGFRKRADDVMNFWNKCCVCSSTHRLDVHHNCYDRLGHEQFTDMVVLCRRCHDIFHDIMYEVMNKTLGPPQ